MKQMNLNLNFPFWFIVLATMWCILAGCASDGGVMSITKLPISDETITAVTGNITDTSVQKEAIFSEMVKNRDNQYRKAYEKYGFKQDWKAVVEETSITTDGKTTVVKATRYLPVTEYKEAPKFAQPLPTGPSEHPAWRFGEKVVTKAADTFLWWTAIKSLGDVVRNGQDKATSQYYGDYNPQTAAPYIVQPEVVLVPAQ